MVNKIVAGVLAIIVLAFWLNLVGKLGNSTQFISAVINNGTKAIRGG